MGINNEVYAVTVLVQKIHLAEVPRAKARTARERRLTESDVIVPAAVHAVGGGGCGGLLLECWRSRALPYDAKDVWGLVGLQVCGVQS